jgi:hypothetical protein
MGVNIGRKDSVDGYGDGLGSDALECRLLWRGDRGPVFLCRGEALSREALATLSASLLA